jgi:hypothetical protein
MSGLFFLPRAAVLYSLAGKSGVQLDAMRRLLFFAGFLFFLEGD